MSTVPPETPMSHAERARKVLDHIRSIKELIAGFSFAGTPDPRTLNFARSLRDDFFENTAVAIEASGDLAKTDRVSPEELRDVIAFSLAFTPVAEEFGIMHKATSHTIALRRATVGDRALEVYHFAKALTKKKRGRPELLIPHFEAMKRTLAKNRRAPLQPPAPDPSAPPTKEPATKGGAAA